MPPINGQYGGGGSSNGFGGRSGSQGAILREPIDEEEKDESGASDVVPKKAPARKTRYGRSATTSVTQLLSTSCNTLLQKFRRNPSEKPEKKMTRASSSTQR